MRYMYAALNWAFGIIFILLSLVMLLGNPLAALSLFAIALLLLPPVRYYVHVKTGRTLLTKTRAISVVVLLLFAVFLVSQYQPQRALFLPAIQQE